MMRPLRILVVSDVSPLSIVGGGERVLWEQASRLQRLGHDVRIVSRTPADGAATTVEGGGVRVRHFCVNRRSDLRLLVSSIVEARRAATKELARQDADLLHLHQPLSGFGVLRSKAGARIPSLYTFHSPAPLEYGLGCAPRAHRGRVARRVGMAVLSLIEGACLRRVTRIHVLSDFSAGLLRDLYRIPADRIVKIPGGVDHDRFRPAADPDAVRRALGLPERRPVLFTVRNLKPRTGVDILIRAMAILRRHVPDVLLLVGGAGALQRELEALTASLGLGNQVRFLGFVPDERLPLYYQAADLFVLPTRELEGFGLVTVEALACGTPVVGTSVGATPEILEPLDPTLLFRDPSPNVMAEGIMRALEGLSRDSAAGPRLREACRRHATSQYAWTHSVARLEGVLRELCDRRHGETSLPGRSPTLSSVRVSPARRKLNKGHSTLSVHFSENRRSQ